MLAHLMGVFMEDCKSVKDTWAVHIRVQFESQDYLLLDPPKIFLDR